MVHDGGEVGEDVVQDELLLVHRALRTGQPLPDWPDRRRGGGRGKSGIRNSKGSKFGGGGIGLFGLNKSERDWRQ